MTIKNRKRKALHNLSPYQPGKSVAEVVEELESANIIKMASNKTPLGSGIEFSDLEENFEKIQKFWKSRFSIFSNFFIFFRISKIFIFYLVEIIPSRA